MHVYKAPESQGDRELVYYPLDPDNSNWIARTCETGSFTYREQDQEFTPYGVVLKVIKCVPSNQESEPKAQDRPVTLQFRYTGDTEIIPDELRVRDGQDIQQLELREE